MTITKKIQIINIKTGKNVEIINPVNLYECEIGDKSFIGPFVEIQKNVIIGSNTRIQSHSFICSNVKIGNGCFIGHGVMFINDKFENGRPSGKSVFRDTQVGNKVSLGSNSTILPVNICDNVVIGAGSVVTKDINKPGIYLGNPAKFLRNF